MLKRNLKPNDKFAADVIDTVGDVAIIRCFACEKPFGVPGVQRSATARSCPHCHQTTALNAYGDVTAWISEDGRSLRWAPVAAE